jgi:hypothetical protein
MPEKVGHDAYAKMRLAGAVEFNMMAGFDMVMPRMLVALVDDVQPLGSERLLELFFDPCLNGHRRLQ